MMVEYGFQKQKMISAHPIKYQNQKETITLNEDTQPFET